MSVISFPPPTLGESRHRGLARRGIAVRRRAVLMVPKGERPHHPRLTYRRGSCLYDESLIKVLYRYLQNQ
jgi:hypothetical protein